MKGVKCNTCLGLGLRLFACTVAFHLTIKFAAIVLATREKKDGVLWTRRVYEKECTTWPNAPAVLLWDILEKASVLVQILGVDALALITVVMSFLRLDEIKKQCRKLDECLRMLRVTLSSPAGRWIMSQQQESLELGEMSSVLSDAQGLIESYNESTLFSRIRKGRSMARQFQDLHNKIDNYCRIIQANPPPLIVRVEVNDRDQVSASTAYSSAASASPSITGYEVINGEETAEVVVVQEAAAQDELNDTLVDEEQMTTAAAANGDPVAEEKGGPANAPPPLAVAATILQPRSSAHRRSPRLTSREDPNYVSMMDRAMNLKCQQKEGSTSVGGSASL